ESETTIRGTINAVTVAEPAAAALDHEVVEECVVLHAARAKREAMRQADEGRYDDARQTLGDAAEDLRKIAPMSARSDELMDEVARLEGHSVAMSPPDYSSTIRK